MSTTKTGTWQFTEHKPESFTYDDMIDAYLKGVEEGVAQTRKALRKQLEENLNRAAKHTSRVISEIKNKNFDVHSARLKIHDWDEVEVLIVVPQDHFLDSRFLEIYDLINEYEKEFSNEEQLYSITFSFIDYAESLDQEQIESDGFLLEYNMEQQ